MNFERIAKEVLENVGGANNVAHVTHCVTRLRFNLKDDSKADIDKIKKIKGVMGQVNKGGQFQVIIGNDVSDVYKELLKLGNFKSSNNQEEEKGAKKGIITSVFDTIAGIFTPIIPAIAGCGMLKAFLGLFVALGLISTETQTYYIFSFISDAAFFFMPLLLAYTAGIKFKTSPFLAMVIGGVLLHPSFSALVSAGEPVSFLGLPVRLVNYSFSVIPIILIVWLMSYVEKLANKFIPKVLRLVFVPLIVITVTAPIGLIVIGPLGTVIGDVLASGIMFIDSKATWTLPLIMGGLTPLIVMTGMHYSLYPALFTQLATLGYQTLMPGMLISNVCQGAAALCVSIKSKNSELKQLASSTGITALLGITEPAMYGVNLKLKKPLYAVLCGGALGGLYAGLTAVKGYTPSGSGLPGIAAYIGPEMSNVVNILIACGIGFVATFIITWFIGFEDEVNEDEAVEEISDVKALKNKISIKSPVKGEAVPLSQVDDPTFAEEIMGKGIAIIPTEDEIFSPINGTVSLVFNTKHAIGLKTEDGAEVLIHIGLDTVKLNGEHFTTFVKSGDKVKVGDKLVEFDREAIKNKGYDIITPIIITNSSDYLDIIPKDVTSVNQGDEVLAIL
ncbi:beta-glucoside-specific PTS transporter subunit IIABC [Clostridium sp.]|uniref:beta-glucoside-specific PTS transporter subunit IIABC n=1 Tax=Clostridium sp. TaxID=1506 RepID=UPI002907A6FA|nr:beta-glucoside-specific PTS transporter subunit IIABC [Clostridium sp.]MDU7215044.1 beta-glucoside-specific PTS transporter subunit IIABC [Clostridium sp.]